MARRRRASTASSGAPEGDGPDGGGGGGGGGGQEMASMYDYLAKIILLGPSGCGKSCLLHRFVQGEWRVVSSQTIGVEFASKIVQVGPPGRRRRVKLQLWDTAGTERFRSVSRSYYRGAAGAVLVYDVASRATFAQLPTFLNDARALASPQLTLVLAGNKADLDESEPEGDGRDDARGAVAPGRGSPDRATRSRPGGAMAAATAAADWASRNRIPASVEVSALSGDGVDEVFHQLARTILTKIELGEIDPDDPMSGIQYGDADYPRDDDDGTSSIKSGLTADDGYGSTRRRRRRRPKGGVLRGANLGGGVGGKCC